MPQIARFPDNMTASELLALARDLRSSGGYPMTLDEELVERFDVASFGRKPLRTLSGGTRQKVNAALAFLFSPSLLMLDEPTAGLDPAGRDDMLALVARLGSFGISVLMATHLLDDVQQVCDHVVMIEAGRLVVSGATASLLERTGRVTIDVGLHGEELVAGLARTGVTAELIDHLVEATVDDDDAMDVVRDVLADLELPLFRLSTRLTSLDEVFVRRIGAST